MTEKCCGACQHRNGINEYYAYCGALAVSKWDKKGMLALPFWTPWSVIVRPDMTTQTLAKEGSKCAAYIALDSPSAVEQRT